MQDGLDIGTDGGRLVLRILLSVAEYPLDGVRAGWDAARERAIRRGVHLSRPVPVGYRKTRAKRLRPHPRTGPIMTEVFRRRAAGATLLQCCHYLEAERVLTGSGNPGWAPDSVSKMLRSRTYLGEVFCGPYVCVDAHPPLTDPVSWHAVQRPPNVPRHSKLDALLVGLVRCASCRHSLRPCTSRQSSKTPKLNYACNKRHAAGTCVGPAIITATKLEPYVLDAVLTILRNRRRLPAARIAAAQQRARSDAQALARYRDNDRIAALVGEQRFLDGLAIRQERVREANLDLLDLQTHAGIHDLPSVDEVRRLLTEAPRDERRQLIGQVIDVVFVWPGRGPAAERVTVCPAGSAPRLLPRQGDRGRVNLPIEPRRGWINPRRPPTVA